MRKVTWSSDSDAAAAEADAAVRAHPGRNRDIWKGFAAFLLGITLGVTTIIFGRTAIDVSPGTEPASVWSAQPQLRH